MYLILYVCTEPDGTFQVHTEIRDCVKCHNSVITIDYGYTPWIRNNGNLLWD